MIGRCPMPQPAHPRPELAALLDAANQDLDDLTPRLILADWLQDQPGEDDRVRGEYVRLHAEIDRIVEQDPATRAVRDWARLGNFTALSGPVLDGLVERRPEVADWQRRI